MPTKKPFTFKFGKKPATPDGRDLLFAAYRTTPLPKRPAQFGHEGLVKAWGMLGNDQFGDCVWAGAAHETMLWNAEAGVTVPFNNKCVLSDYSAVTGFNPKDPNSDQGTDMREAMKYRKDTGILDANGKRHQIGAYTTIRVGSKDMMERIKEALYLEGAVALGFQVPQSCMDQFNQGKPWTVVRRSPIEGGHYVCLVCLRDMLYVVTWEKLQPVTDAFIQTYADQIFVPVSKERLTNGKSLEGFDYDQLAADAAQLAR